MAPHHKNHETIHLPPSLFHRQPPSPPTTKLQPLTTTTLNPLTPSPPSLATHRNPPVRSSDTPAILMASQIKLQSSDSAILIVGTQFFHLPLSPHPPPLTTRPGQVLCCRTGSILTFVPATDKAVAERSVLIKNMLEDVGEVDEAIPIPNVSRAPALWPRGGHFVTVK